MKAKASENNKDLEGLVKVQEYLKFIEFMALPASLRKKVFGYITGGKFAKEFNVSIDTLTDWKRRDGFWERVRKIRKEWVKEKVSEVLDALYKKSVAEGNANEVKLFLQYAEEFEDSKTLKFEDNTKVDEKRKKVIDAWYAYLKNIIKQKDNEKDSSES